MTLQNIDCRCISVKKLIFNFINIRDFHKWYQSVLLVGYKELQFDNRRIGLLILSDLQCIFCIYENRRQRIKSSKMVIEHLDKNQLSYFYILNPAWSWCSLTVYISNSFIDMNVKFWHNLDSSLKILLLKFWSRYFFIFWKLFPFRHRWNFVNFLFFSSELLTEWDISNSDGFIVKISFRSIRINPFSILKYILW